MVKAAELYPLREPQKENEDLQIPYQLVAGESVLFLGETRRGIISVSNYRLYITTPQGHINLPLGLIEQVDIQDLFFLNIYCKDGRYYRINFGSGQACEDWAKKICDELSPPVKIEDVFAFAHYAWIAETGLDEIELAGEREADLLAATNGLGTASGVSGTNGPSGCLSDPGGSAWFRSELERLRFDLQGAWRVSLVNTEHKLCSTYPQQLVLPACISDTTLEKVAQFRSSRRIPAVVWRNPSNGAVLARCSQPEVGWLGWRSAEDEELVRAIAYASTYDSGRQRTLSESSMSEDSTAASVNGEIPSLKDLSAEVAGLSEVKKVLIIDARSYAAAVGNRARGGGVECQEYYSNTEILFMNMPNIHSIRKSFNALRLLCHSAPEQTAWFQGLDSTKWLHHISGLLKAAVRCATALQVEGRPVIVHCSDGWDRTPQIVSLAQLMLDPYYRSMEGFQVLVEKEWLHFGHKMADRCGQGLGGQDQNERSPIFLQWLDCVHQLLLQFPVSFQFNLSFLYKIVQHTYSNIFGTFLCNSLYERKQMKICQRTRSIWPFLRSHPAKFRNFLFVEKNEILWPRCEVRDLLLWKEVYVGEISDIQDIQAGLEDTTHHANGRALSLPHEASSQNNEAVAPLCPTLHGENGDTNSSPSAASLSVHSPHSNSTSDTSRSSGCVEALPISQSVADLTPVYTLLDSDGLPTKYDKVQRRLVEIFSLHEAHLSKLKRDLCLSRLGSGGAQVGDVMQPENCSVEEQIESRSGVESATSEVSWEALDEGEARPTLWVPDHAASACMGCRTEFWFGLRKHHCRSCGRLFCSECSLQSVPIPAEQLYSPVRVCNTCYKQITTGEILKLIPMEDHLVKTDVQLAKTGDNNSLKTVLNEEVNSKAENSLKSSDCDGSNPAVVTRRDDEVTQAAMTASSKTLVPVESSSRRSSSSSDSDGDDVT